MMLDDFGRSASFGIDKVQQIFPLLTLNEKLSMFMSNVMGLHLYEQLSFESILLVIKACFTFSNAALKL